MFKSKDKKFFDSRFFCIFTMIKRVFAGLNKDIVQINLKKFFKDQIYSHK